MRDGVVLLLLATVSAGCHGVFGLLEVTDAGDDDDYPENPVCPAAGAPTFREDVREIVPRKCVSYSVSETGLAVAYCFNADANVIEEGAVGKPLAVAELVPVTSEFQRIEPALSPEGNDLVVRHFKSQDERLSWYTRVGSSWVYVRDIAASNTTISGGAPSAAPDRRILVTNVDGVRELAQQGDGTWIEVATHSWASLGIAGNVGHSMSLSADALHVTFLQGQTVKYASRTSRDVGFDRAVTVAIGEARSAFMTRDCAAIYYAGLSSVYRRYQE